jgi:hypothetical protein
VLQLAIHYCNSHSASGSGRTRILNLWMIRQLFYHCAAQPFLSSTIISGSLTGASDIGMTMQVLCHYAAKPFLPSSIISGSLTGTFDLGMMRQVFYQCAIAIGCSIFIYHGVFWTQTLYLGMIR